MRKFERFKFAKQTPKKRREREKEERRACEWKEREIRKASKKKQVLEKTPLKTHKPNNIQWKHFCKQFGVYSGGCVYLTCIPSKAFAWFTMDNTLINHKKQTLFNILAFDVSQQNGITRRLTKGRVKRKTAKTSTTEEKKIKQNLTRFDAYLF